MFQVIYTFSNKLNCINSDHLLLQVWIGRYIAYVTAFTRTILSWPGQKNKPNVTKGHFSLFDVSGEKSVGFSQNSGDITVL